MTEPDQVKVSNALSEFYSDWYVYSDASRSTWEKTKRMLTARDAVASLDVLAGPRFGHLVDVGAGDGSVLLQLHENGSCESLAAVEISSSGVGAIKARGIPDLRVEHFDGYTIPFADDTFDTAVCIHVLEHVEHERRFIRELSRVAKRVYVEIPLEGGLRGRPNRAYGHINYYTPPFFLNLLETSGAKPVAWRVFSSSLDVERHHYGQIGGMVRYLIRRSALKMAGPNIAPHFMTYLMGVVFEKVRD
jgi:ubiquinone/menaquinone biosynthesis C-methylase UbiE